MNKTSRLPKQRKISAINHELFVVAESHIPSQSILCVERVNIPSSQVPEKPAYNDTHKHTHR